MPPRRKAAAASTTRAQTLHSFSTIGKNIFKSGKPIGKPNIITEAKKSGKIEQKIELIPSFEIQQDGDEDVIIRHQELMKAKPTEAEEVKPTEAEEAKPTEAEEVKPVEVQKAKPTKVQKAKPKSSPARARTPAVTASGKRKRTLLDDFARPTKKRETLTPKSTCYPTPPTTSSPAPKEIEDPSILATTPTALPADLTLLQSLHSSLLTALLLHRAHNNNSINPPVFTAIKLHVERLCRRKITLEDVRKIVYLSHYSTDQKEMDEHWEKEGGLKLIDYGKDKICIDFSEKTKARKLVNSDNLKTDFGTRVRAFWETTNTNPLPTPPSSFSDSLKPRNEDDEPKTGEGEDEEEEEAEIKPEVIAIPMSIIPLAKLHAHPKATTIAKVLHTKGQQRLEDLLRRHKQPTISFPSAKNTISTAPPAKRGSSLLDRIRAKAALAAEAASVAPSKEELERTAAEQRIPDIEPILKGLAARGSNMTMKACIEGIRESVRNPVSTEQAEMAVRLIAEREGETGWVKVREVGRVVGVVFTKREADGEFM